MLTYARTRGVDVDAILDDIGVSPSALDDFDQRIPEASRCRAWVEAAEAAQDPFFGLHVVERSSVGAYDVLDYSLCSSSTLGEGLEELVRFHSVLCDAWASRFGAEGGVYRMRRVERTPSHEVEALFALLVLRARELTGVDIVPHEVRFAHAAPPDTTHHAELFRCPVRFACPASELMLDAGDVALSIKTADRRLEGVLERYMTEVLGRLPRNDTLVERVRATVARQTGGGRPTLSRTAREQHMSPRTLQRKLSEHGTRFAEVVEAHRREVAERLVTEGQMSVTEIAFLLGFADVGSFRRLYKRWTGTPPSRGRPPP
jgi:AraC-like DNA-binding protein